MKFLAVGNRFIRWETISDFIKKEIKDAEVVGYNTGWPIDLSEGVYKGEEVSEYDGKEAKIIEHAAGIDYLVTDVAPITKKVMDAMPDLKAIAVTRGGAVNINIDHATEKKIPVFNSPGRNLGAVAEFTVAFALAQMKKIPIANQELKKGKWRSDFYSLEEVGSEISESTIGIIGFGNIGRQVAKSFYALGAQVLIFDPFIDHSEIEAAGYIATDIDSLYKQSDIVTIHARVTDENKKMVGAEQFAMMKPTAIFINTARDGLVDYDALYDALKEGRIGGAALDVFDKEPLPKDSRYFELDNLTITPHLSGASLGTIRQALDMALGDLIKYSKGEPTQYCLNKEVL